MTIKPPFPWFGGKSRVADQVWRLLGNVENYVEPFFGSGAVLFARPHQPRIETVNDIDHWVANFWRAVQNAPEQVAAYADNPVNEDDLTARHIWLVKYAAPELANRIPADPDYYDPKVAGWWVWGICCWIGSGWCRGNGPWTEQDGRLVRADKSEGVSKRLVHLGSPGQGVNRKLVHLGDAGLGVNRQQQGLVGYFRQIADRLRGVRVCSGDWSRVVTNGATAHGSTVGVFLDPPYSQDMRDTSIYNSDASGIAADVRRWCIDNGSNPRYRIVLCGYEGEHNELEAIGWHKIGWKANRAYGRENSETDNNTNRTLERLWASPNCVGQKSLFGGG